MRTENVSNDGQAPAPAGAGAGVEEYINKTQLARRINKTVRTVDTWMAKGWIPFYKLGRTVAFRWSEVDAHIQANFRVGVGR